MQRLIVFQKKNKELLQQLYDILIVLFLSVAYHKPLFIDFNQLIKLMNIIQYDESTFAIACGNLFVRDNFLQGLQFYSI